MNELILLVWPASSSPRCHFGILLIWPASSSRRCHFSILLFFFWPASSIAVLPSSWHPLVWPASFHHRAAIILSSSHLAGIFHRRTAIILASSRLAGVFHRRTAIILASSHLASVFPLPRCHHLGILLFGRHLPSPRCHIGILSFGRCLPLPRCHFGILVWPASFHRRATISVSSFGRCLPSPHRHKRCRQSPRHLLSSRPALSIAAPPSLILAGSFICHATISYLGLYTSIGWHI